MIIDLQKVKLPKKISPCPILEGVVEFRFESSFPHDAIFGIVYNELKKDYPNLQELPILQLPEVVRSQDPNLRHKPYYRLMSEDKKYLFQVGARVFSLINLNPYDGWSAFSEKLKNLIERMNKISIVDTYTRVGIRYINGFDINILKKINLYLGIEKNHLVDLDTTIRLEVPSGDYTNTLQVINNARVKKDGEVSKGSIVDIDTFIENPKKEIFDIIEEAHLAEKKLFFTLLKDEFIKKELNPEY